MAITTQVFRATNTGTRNLELKEAIVDEVTWNLNGIHSAKVSFDPLNPDAALILLDEVELSIVLGDDYNNIWQGIPRGFQGNFGKVQFTLDGVAAYLQDAYVLDTDKVYSGVEQMNIATDLVTYAQAATFQSRGILIGSYSGSGVFRDRTYLAEDYHDVYSLITAFPGLINGFEWDIVTASDGSRRFTPYYPRKGSLKSAYKIWFDAFGQSPFWQGMSQFQKQSMGIVTDQITTGPQGVNPDGTSTGIKLRGRFTDTTTVMGRFGRRQKVTAANEDVDQAWLDDQAEALEKASAFPQVLPKINVSDSLFGQVWHGDSLPVRIDWGVIQADANYRITTLTVKPPSGVLELTLQAE